MRTFYNFFRILSLARFFEENFSFPLYIRKKTCYTIRMGLRKFFKDLLYKRRLKKYGLSFPLRTKLHGVTSHDRQGALAQSAAADELQIVHSPLKRYPHNAYVYSITLNRVLGYLDKELAQKLLAVFGEGYCLDGEIKAVTGGTHEHKYFGCILYIYDSKDMLSHVDDFSHLHE